MNILRFMVFLVFGLLLGMLLSSLVAWQRPQAGLAVVIFVTTDASERSKERKQRNKKRLHLFDLNFFL